MSTKTTPNKISTVTPLKNEIIKTILYFEIFHYPLTAGELFQHHHANLNEHEFRLLLNEMVEEKHLKFSEPFYFSPFGSESWVNRRVDGNRMALAAMPEAIRWARRLNRFPFVRSVNLSGSIAKNYFDRDSDFDYFIITKANRIWICRTFIVLYWRLLSKENKKKLCTNYFIDETAFELIDKNRFTATELCYLVPVINNELAQALFKKNPWVKNYIENKTLLQEFVVEDKPGFFKSLIEALLNNRLGNMIDDVLLKLTIKRWRKKYPDLSEEDFELQFRSRKNVCKRHSKGFQNKVLQSWANKKSHYEKSFGIQLG